MEYYIDILKGETQSYSHGNVFRSPIISADYKTVCREETRLFLLSSQEHMQCLKISVYRFDKRHLVKRTIYDYGVTYKSKRQEKRNIFFFYRPLTCFRFKVARVLPGSLHWPPMDSDMQPVAPHRLLPAIPAEGRSRPGLLSKESHLRDSQMGLKTALYSSVTSASVR